MSMDREARRDAARERARELRAQQTEEQRKAARTGRIGQVIAFTGWALVAMCVLFWVIALWIDPDTGGRLAATGGILVIPCIIVGVVGTIVWIES